jgi:osmoprotectant transport system substrate-binding protein
VRVGSKNFTEQVILGEIVSRYLEAHGYAVEPRLNLGGTSLCHGGLLSGELDVYVEYTGTALTDILKEKSKSDPGEVLSEVRDGYRRLGLVTLSPLGFNDTFALVVRRDFLMGKTRISDLRPLAPTLRFGLFGEFLERPDGLPGLLKAYDMQLGVPPREMDLGLLYQSLVHGGVDVVVGNSTDGLITRLDLLTLQDDRHFFPSYDALPVTSERSLRAHPGLQGTLEGLGGKIEEAAMRRMNDEVDGKHRSPKDVAAEFLENSGLLER